MTRPSGPVLALIVVLAVLFAFAGYHDKPSDTQELADMQADLTDAQADAMAAGLGRK